MQKHGHLQDIFIRNKAITDCGITFINGSNKEVFLSYQSLYERAMRLLCGLRGNGMQAGQELLFQIADNQTFIEYFWACIMGRIIPVPITLGYNDETRLKVFKVWSKLNNPYLLSVGNEVVEGLNKFILDSPSYSGQLDEMKQKNIYTSQIDIKEGLFEIIEPERDDIAFIQFSSGSTGDPKGVILTHHNLISNAYAIGERWEIKPKEAALSWMPLTHDMGLIGMHITNSLAQTNQYIMPADLFIRNPLLWMEKTNEHRVNYLFSPNFGYNHFLTFFHSDHDYKWDLSNVHYICNGAEPISTVITEKFLDQMGRYGLKSSALKSVYGLAEGTVGVSMTYRGENYKYVSLDHNSILVGQPVNKVDRQDNSSILYADVGYPIQSCEVNITDKQGQELADETLGYIRIRGDSVTKGYYNDPEASIEMIDHNGWLNTGDLGFMYEGRLVVVGREKDVLFVNGQNVFSHDIERVAQEVDGIELGKVAACGVRKRSSNRDEVLLVLQFRKKELKPFYKLAKQVADHIHYRLGIMIDYVLPARSIPKTTSGKIQRYKLAGQFLNGEFDSILTELEMIKAEEMAFVAEHTQYKLAYICRDVLGHNIGLHENFNDSGGSSLALTKIIDEMQKHFGIEIAITDLYKYPTIAKLTQFIDSGESVLVPSIRMPGNYFDSNSHSVETFEAVLDQRTTNAIQNMAISSQVDVWDVLASIFIYVLREVSGEHLLTVQIGKGEELFGSIDIDFDQFDHLEDLFTSVNYAKKDYKSTQNYVTKDFKNRHRDHNEQGLIPYITQFPTYVTSQLKELSDLLLEIKVEKTQISFICDYNFHRLNEGKVKELLTQYITLVTDISNQVDDAALPTHCV